MTRPIARLALALMLAAFAGKAMAEPIRGSGSTFAFPVIAAWSKAYLEDRAGGTDYVPADNGIDYEPVGSLGGVLRLSQPDIDFAATDAPIPSDELEKRGLAQFPIVMGGVAVVFNLDGIGPGGLKLDGAVLADIYRGEIQRWNHPALAAINPEATLPDARIVVVHRIDGSGTTYNFTRYLSSFSEAWRATYGADTLIAWPLGVDARGNSGVAAAVAATPGAIGYVQFGQVRDAALSFAMIKNKAGHFVAPQPASFQAAAAGADWAGTKDFYLHLTDAAAADAYPIAATTFVVMHKDGRSAADTRRVLGFLRYALTNGGASAERLGYVPLPAALVDLVEGYWKTAFAEAGL